MRPTSTSRPEGEIIFTGADVVIPAFALSVGETVIELKGKVKDVQSKPDMELELGLNPANLRQRISQRTEQLYAQGLIEETQQLKERYGADLPLLQTIGYGEALQVLEGQLDRTDAIAQTTKRTQQFAKRQRTWFRRQHQPHWLSDTDPFNDASQLIEAGLG